MANTTWIPPRRRNWLLGLLAFSLLLVGARNLTLVVKAPGNAMLYIPARAGLVQQANRDEILELLLSNSANAIELDAGRYAVYTNNMGILQSNSYAQSTNHPWLIIQELNANKPTEVKFTERGLRPWDTLAAQGRPLLYFDVQEPGRYEISHIAGRLHAIITIVPFFSAENESAKAAICGLLPLFAVLVMALIAFRRFKRETRAQLQRRVGADQIIDLNR